MQARLAERVALLRRLRGAQPQPQPQVTASVVEDLQGLEDPAGPAATFDNRQMQVAGHLYQAQEINITNVFDLQWRWVRPAPPNLTKELVERSEEIEAVIKKLRAQGAVAISAISSPSAVAVQGMPGAGKTSLARLLARKLDRDYPDGVLWADVGPRVKTREDATAILNAWAAYFVGGIADTALTFTPEAVRALMSEHPRLLAILDNVWSLDAIKPLREALPGEAHLILTTRSLEVMRNAGGATHTVGLLSKADARALVALRLRWTPGEDSSDAAWVDDLIVRLGYHPLALDIALGLMASEGFTPEEWRATAQRVIEQVRQGTDFGALKLPEEVDREANVEAALAVSYRALDEAAQARFRALGAFAPEADFATAHAAAVWGCDETAARTQLTQFVQRAVLDRRDDDVWRQHAVLRGYALALLRDAGEYDEVRARHTEIYDQAMQAADAAQRYYEMLPALPQLRHAFAWAVEQDLARAQGLIGHCAALQAAFGFAREGLDWCEQALEAARRRGTPADVARAHGSLGIALARVADLPGEDRRQRLYDALAAYDEALQFRRPDTAPLDYAMTQNNRATLLRDLAALPGEDRRQRLYDALRIAWEARLLFEQVQFADPQDINRRTLIGIRTECGDDFEAIWQALDAGDAPDWLR
ncbi:MAG: hypothetical protein KatS3mg053_1199 [Candidatus Roseilinea sp.]|nr:MAG: hypothetical protein KatS3mg053_1199 [Candidatus Roseilinea sp.]